MAVPREASCRWRAGVQFIMGSGVIRSGLAWQSPKFDAGVVTRYRSSQRRMSPCESSEFSRLCSARLQAGIRLTPKCPPEGGRYIN